MDRGRDRWSGSPSRWGSSPLYVPELQREISLAADLPAALRLRKLITRAATRHPAHAHRKGGRGRADRGGDSRSRATEGVVHTFHGHVLRGLLQRAWKTALFGQLERNLARMSDALIAVSPQVRDDLVKLGVAPAEKITVVRLGLDLEAERSSRRGSRRSSAIELGLAADRFLVGLARADDRDQADADLLLRAFARLREQTPGAICCSSGTGRSAASSKRWQANSGLGLVPLHRASGTTSARCSPAVDAVALTSANEGTPVTLIEALAAGRPVVSTDVGGVRDVVGPETGFLVPAGDFEAIAESLRPTCGRPGAPADRLGNAGRASVLERYSVPRLVDDVDLLYRELLETAGTTTRGPGGPPEASASTSHARHGD